MTHEPVSQISPARPRQAVPVAHPGLPPPDPRRARCLPRIAVAGASEGRLRWARWLVRAGRCVPALPGERPVAALRWLRPAPGGTGRDVAALAAGDRAGIRTVGIVWGPRGRAAAEALPLAETVPPWVRPRRLSMLLLGERHARIRHRGGTKLGSCPRCETW